MRTKLTPQFLKWSAEAGHATLTSDNQLLLAEAYRAGAFSADDAHTVLCQMLFAALTKDHPAPWQLRYHELQLWHDRQYVAAIVAANGETPLTLETHSGDGDLFFLGSEGAEALVAFVNGVHASLDT